MWHERAAVSPDGISKDTGEGTDHPTSHPLINAPIVNHFAYRSGELHVEDVALRRVAEAFGTPCYVYSRAALTEAFNDIDQAFTTHPHLICYAVKANSNLAVLNVFARLGAGFDIVSGGELARVLAAGGDARKIVFSGIGKRESEIRQALAANILCFNVESESELHRINMIAGELGRTAPISLRVNPDVDAKTHPYISTGLKNNKFGIAYHEAQRLYQLAYTLPHLTVAGIDCHIGSQIIQLSPFANALDKILALVDVLDAKGISLRHIDLGGGLGIRYVDELPPTAVDYSRLLQERLNGRPQMLLLEPGRLLAGNAGVLLTRVEYLKHGETKNFAIVDAAMNDLMRPALYNSFHEILPLTNNKQPAAHYEIVGPICESGDFLGHDRQLALAEGDVLSVMSAGAYGMTMSSNYNTRPRVAEVMVDGEAIHLVRQRETLADLYANEHHLP